MSRMDGDFHICAHYFIRQYSMRWLELHARPLAILLMSRLLFTEEHPCESAKPHSGLNPANSASASRFSQSNTNESTSKGLVVKDERLSKERR
jgi:hypothetical protein